MLYGQGATDPSVALFYQINKIISINIDTNINIYIITKITMINKDNTKFNMMLSMLSSRSIHEILAQLTMPILTNIAVF